MCNKIRVFQKWTIGSVKLIPERIDTNENEVIPTIKIP